MSLRAHARLFATISLLGCGQGAATEGSSGDAGSLGDAGADDAATPPLLPQAGAGAAPSAGAGGEPAGAPQLRPQTNVSFETAERVEPGDAPYLQDERSADQVDYFVFAGEAGAFYEITTDRGTFMPDNALALYDAAHRLIAQNDDGGLGAGAAVDARLVVRLPSSGDYYVTVEDPWTPEAFFASTLPLLFYHFALRELTEDTPGVSIARDEAAVTVSFVEDAATGFAYALLLAEPGADELTFDLEGRAQQVLIGSVVPAGSKGNGSTVEGGELRVVDDASRVVARIDRGLGQHELHPPVSDARYQLQVGAVDAPGDNAFHVIDLVLLPDNPSERADDTNGEQSEAEQLVLEGGTWRRGLVLLSLPPDDEDYFVLEGRDSDVVTVVCEAQSGGSGVRGLRAELLDDQGVLAWAVETPDENLLIDAVPIAAPGPIYLRVWSDGAAADDDVEPWARCALDIGP